MGAAFNALMEEETKESLARMCCDLMAEINRVKMADAFTREVIAGWSITGKPPKTYEFLDEDFLTLMNDIGRYGEEKYGAESFHARAATGDRSRSLKRTQKEEIMRHARKHTADYEAGVRHDHFDTLRHQLGAAAFNCMMEFYFSRHEQGE